MLRDMGALFAKVVREFFEQAPRGDQERLAAEVGVKSPAISGWKTDGKCHKANMLAFASKIPSTWAERVRDAWFQEHSEPEVWDELVRRRAHTGEPPSPAAYNADQVLARIPAEARKMFVEMLAQLAEVPEARVVKTLYDVVYGAWRDKKDAGAGAA